jgi:hypothetical protein
MKIYLIKYQHGILEILFRYKGNNPRWYRSSVIYGRYMSLLGAAGYLSYLVLFYL